MVMLLEDIVESVELWLKLIRKKPQPYVDPDLDPVLLVPGIAGSILKAVDDKGREERVWVRILSADYKCRTKLWSLFDPSTGKTVSLDPKSNLSVPEDRDGLYAIDILDPDLVIGRDCVYYFHDMIVEMIKWGFQEGKTLFGFGYDFRQSNRCQETLELLAAKMETVFTASGGKKLTIITHSMGGLLVKCFMCLHSDIFEKYVKSWIAIAAPFQGAPGYVTSTFVNGMSFVEGWEQNFFISKWSMHQLVKYDGVDIPLPFNLEILKWANETRKVLSSAKLPPQVKFYNVYGTNLETPHSVCYGSEGAPVTDLQQLPSLMANYVCVDGDGTVPVESAKVDGLNAEARVGIPGEHRGILCDRHLFRILKHWLDAGDPDPFYNPLNDYVILPTLFEIERHQEKGFQVTSLKEEWEIIGKDQDDQVTGAADRKPLVSSISVSNVGDEKSMREEARATVIVHPRGEGRQHVELNAVSVTANV
ncbi:lecithin-cholesterol acyltransferase-like 4 isoform X2 [Rhododendron vialii]|uniref:lecithin-cholesterol acyltransferase-like 4 isoform X2 n=1 Tax=Rhododendron vialii TaxID=182163 RepID=UPI00265E98A9|nr:lecithin-cholesterol acyltransferase-like 4 isoform X2 [Rhododendron vialii]